MDSIVGALSYDKHMEGTRITVAVNNALATLTGTVFDWKQKAVAERIAQNTEGVVGVKNELSIVDPTYDTLKEIGVINSRNILTMTEMRSALDYHPSLNAAAIKIKAARRPGIFFLRGYVNSAADRTTAEELCEKTPGVKYVVNDLVVDEDLVETAAGWVREEPKEPAPRSLTDKYVVDSANLSILVEIKDALARDRQLDASGISVSAEGFDIGIFHLTGTVPSEEHKRMAGMIAAKIRGVRYIDNDLQIKAP